MARLNLNDAQDFSQATLSNTGALLQTITGTKASEWDIQEGSFNGVLFHVFSSNVPYQGALSQVQDTGGRRKIKYMFPYIDGQTTDDLGRKPESFSFNILLHGKNYMIGFKNLFKELNTEKPGVLIHPVRGRVDCVMEDYQIIHHSEQRKAMAITLTMIEHNFTIGSIETIQDDRSVKSALSTALNGIKSVDTFITKVSGSVKFAQLFKQRLNAALGSYKTAYVGTLGQLNNVFNPSGKNDIPGLLPINKGGVVNDAGQIVTDTFVPIASIASPFTNNIVSSLTPQQVAQVASQDLQNQVNARRDEVNAIIAQVDAGGASLDFHDNVNDLKASGVALQQTLERGLASSNALTTNYTVPRLMSVREVAFANGISPERSIELEILNPSLQSSNFISQGTIMKVPTA